MRKSSLLALLTALSLVSFTACGGSQPAAEEPKSDAAKSDDSKSDEKSDDSKSDEKSDDKGDKKDEKKDEKTSGGMPEVKRTPKDMITAPDVTFMFSFNDSDPKQKAEERCSAQTKNDPKKMAQCMTKEREKFPADGMQFKKNDKGEWTWLTLRRKGSTVTYLHRIPFDFGDEKDGTIVLKLTGKDTGKAPMGKVPSQLTVEVPNEFQIAVKDPEHGRLVYEAKIGITNEGDGKASGSATR